ncbi:O-antigen ligase domain-containing protein [Pseudomonas citronellolis]|nr:O-antigen ligase domain-containing protein [Pseudomonas citronellolis]
MVLILLDQIFFGLIKRLIFSEAGRDSLYYAYLALFPTICTLLFFITLAQKKFTLPYLGSVTTPYYFFMLNLLIVTISNGADEKSALSFFHTYYLLLALPILAHLTKKGLDIITPLRTAMLIALPIVTIHTALHFTYGILPFEQSWANDSWSSLYIGSDENSRVFRPFASFEDPGYLSTYYLFTALTLIIRPFKKTRYNTLVIPMCLALSVIPLKSTPVIAFLISLLLIYIAKRIRQKILLKLCLAGTLGAMALFITTINSLNIGTISSNNYILQERLSLGTLKARMLKYSEILEKIEENPLGHGAAFISMANTSDHKGFVDSDSQYLTILANFGIQGLILYCLILFRATDAIRTLKGRAQYALVAPLFISIMSFTTEILSTRFIFLVSIIVTSYAIASSHEKKRTLRSTHPRAIKWSKGDIQTDP